MARAPRIAPTNRGVASLIPNLPQEQRERAASLPPTLSRRAREKLWRSRALIDAEASVVREARPAMPCTVASSGVKGFTMADLILKPRTKHIPGHHSSMPGFPESTRHAESHLSGVAVAVLHLCGRELRAKLSGATDTHRCSVCGRWLDRRGISDSRAEVGGESWAAGRGRQSPRRRSDDRHGPGREIACRRLYAGSR